MESIITRGETFDFSSITAAPDAVSQVTVDVLDWCSEKQVNTLTVSATVSSGQLRFKLPQTVTRMLELGGGSIRATILWQGTAETLYRNIFVLDGTAPDAPTEPVVPGGGTVIQLGTVRYGIALTPDDETRLSESFNVASNALRHTITLNTLEGAYAAIWVPQTMRLVHLNNQALNVDVLSQFSQATIRQSQVFTLGPLNPGLTLNYTATFVAQ